MVCRGDAVIGSDEKSHTGERLDTVDDPEVTLRRAAVHLRQLIRTRLGPGGYSIHLHPRDPLHASDPAFEVHLKDDSGARFPKTEHRYLLRYAEVLGDIDRWTLEAVLTGWGRDAPLAHPPNDGVLVNLCSETLCDEGFPEFVAGCLERSHAVTSRICLGIGSEALPDLKRGLDVVWRLQGMGFRFDDSLLNGRRDSLTGCLTRPEVERVFVDTPVRSSHVLCYADLGGVFELNQACGHAAGDELLRQVAVLIRNCAGTSASVARVAGARFGILFTNVALDHGAEFAAALVQAITAFRFPWNDTVFSLTVSVGLVEVTDAKVSFEDGLLAAHLASNRAKCAGGSRVCIAGPDEFSRERIVPFDVHLPLAELPRETVAKEIFPVEGMTPELYAAREAHRWDCFSFDTVRYRDEALTVWVQRLGDILSGRNGAPTLDELRRTLLSLDERAAIDAEIARRQSE